MGGGRIVLLLSNNQVHLIVLTEITGGDDGGRLRHPPFYVLPVGMDFFGMAGIEH